MSNLNSKWVNLIFCIDSSGSMYPSTSDVVGGYQKIIDEQKAIKEGKVTVSLFTFNNEVTEHYVGKDINDIPKFEYNATSMTRMNDGIGTAIDRVGQWLYERDKNGEEMPGVNLFVIMTDGMENSSKEYTLKQVQDKIKEQTEKYSWQFIYQGCDITTTKAADELGIKMKTYSSKKNLFKNYELISCATSTYRNMANTGSSLADASLLFCTALDEGSRKNTADYEIEIGQKLTSV